MAKKKASPFIAYLETVARLRKDIPNESKKFNRDVRHSKATIVKASARHWTREEDEALIKLRNINPNDYIGPASFLLDRTPAACAHRIRALLKPKDDNTRGA